MKNVNQDRKAAYEKSPMSKENKELIREYLKKCRAESCLFDVFFRGDEETFLKWAKEGGGLTSASDIVLYIWTD